jgi:hypothetical protein
MEQNLQTPKTNGNGNGHLATTRKSRPVKADSLHNGHISIFDPNKYMLKLPKTKKVSLPNGQVRFEKTETDYLPVAARIAWFRKDHPYQSGSLRPRIPRYQACRGAHGERRGRGRGVRSLKIEYLNKRARENPGSFVLKSGQVQ